MVQGGIQKIYFNYFRDLKGYGKIKIGLPKLIKDYSETKINLP